MEPKVLVIEDTRINRDLVTAVLSGEGCQVLSAETADVGLAMARAAMPDLIIMDVQLPGMNGYDATRHLKADPATAAIPIVAVTALAMRGEEERARAAGCDAFVLKPMNHQAFRTLLRRYLGRQAPPRGGDDGGHREEDTEK